jgi:hypothetical protein
MLEMLQKFDSAAADVILDSELQQLLQTELRFPSAVAKKLELSMMVS